MFLPHYLETFHRCEICESGKLTSTDDGLFVLKKYSPKANVNPTQAMAIIPLIAGSIVI